ncbi:unnamed protein product [Thlaspi arvense]|uniref:Prolamin-like domain-containing protein n=1 Tax=Thlaspi arvense TaxID=13288 RepID=A0AAU9SY64_THLAR|nr:unnamed protein product [Thlaspi arvense]
MKNVVALVLAMILFSSCVTTKVTARELESTSSLRNEELQTWHHYPRFHPRPHWPFHVPGKAFPPLPAHPVLPPVVTQCLSDSKNVRTCFEDISKTFFTRKAAIGSECCGAIEKMNEDCETTVFGSFHNPFFNCFVKLHCSTKVGSSTSPAPSPALGF